MVEEKEDTVNKDYEIFIDERKILVESHRLSSQSFDKAILTLASGSFGSTFAFMKYLAPKPFYNTKLLLGTSWTFFTITIFIILISFLTSQNACIKQIDCSYRQIVKKENNVKNIWSTFTNLLNITSIITLVMAYIFWGLFIYWNFI